MSTLASGKSLAKDICNGDKVLLLALMSNLIALQILIRITYNEKNYTVK